MSGRGQAGPEVGHVDDAVGPDCQAGRLEQAGYRQRRDGVAVAADPDQGAGVVGGASSPPVPYSVARRRPCRSKAMAVTAVSPRAQILA